MASWLKTFLLTVGQRLGAKLGEVPEPQVSEMDDGFSRPHYKNPLAYCLKLLLLNKIPIKTGFQLVEIAASEAKAFMKKPCWRHIKPWCIKRGTLIENKVQQTNKRSMRRRKQWITPFPHVSFSISSWPTIAVMWLHRPVAWLFDRSWQGGETTFLFSFLTRVNV